MKKLLHILLICGFVLGMAGSVVAQEGEETTKGAGNRIDALKIAYLTNKLNLSPEEAQRFWPIYNQYATELRKLRMDARQNKKAEIDTEEKILNLRKKYNGEFGKALSNEKVNSFFRAEKEFGTFLQKEMLERRQQKIERRRLRN